MPMLREGAEERLYRYCVARLCGERGETHYEESRELYVDILELIFDIKRERSYALLTSRERERDKS